MKLDSKQDEADEGNVDALYQKEWTIKLCYDFKHMHYDFIHVYFPHFFSFNGVITKNY